MKTRITRSTALTLVAAGSVFAARSRTNAAGLPVVRIATPAIDSATALYVAQAQGYFTRAGLAPEITVMSNGQAISSALLSGAMDIGSVNVFSMIMAHAKKIPLRILVLGTVVSTAAPVGGMVVRSDSPITSVQDLDNKIIAVNSLQGIGWISTANWMDTTDANSKSAQFIEMPFSEMPVALASHRVDAILLQEPTLTVTVKKGGVRVIGSPYASISSRWAETAWAASDNWIAKNPENVRRFSAAMRLAAIWANRHHNETAEIVSKTMKIDSDITRSMRRDIFIETPSPGLVEPVIDIAAKYHILAARFPETDLFSSTMLR